MQIGTFHAICLEFLKAQGEEPVLMTEEEQRRLSEETIVESGISISAKRFLEAVSRCKSGTAAEEAMPAEEKIPEEEWKKAMESLREKKEERNLWDFDDLLLRTIQRIENGRTAEGWEKKFRYLLVDEFQDIDPISSVW